MSGAVTLPCTGQTALQKDLPYRTSSTARGFSFVSSSDALPQEPEASGTRGLEDLLAALADRARAGHAAAGSSDSRDGAPDVQSRAPAEQGAAQPSVAELEEGTVISG